jgi:hypothetical protein
MIVVHVDVELVLPITVSASSQLAVIEPTPPVVTIARVAATMLSSFV